MYNTEDWQPDIQHGMMGNTFGLILDGDAAIVLDNGVNDEPRLVLDNVLTSESTLALDTSDHNATDDPWAEERVRSPLNIASIAHRLTPVLPISGEETEVATISPVSPDCSICLGQITDPSTIVPCGHLFDNDCIIPWMETSQTCPLCREPVDAIISGTRIQDWMLNGGIRRFLDQRFPGRGIQGRRTAGRRTPVRRIPGRRIQGRRVPGRRAQGRRVAVRRISGRRIRRQRQRRPARNRRALGGARLPFGTTGHRNIFGPGGLVGNARSIRRPMRVTNQRSQIRRNSGGQWALRQRNGTAATRRATRNRAPRVRRTRPLRAGNPNPIAIRRHRS